MSQSIVSRTVSRSNRNMLLLSIAGLVILGAFGALTLRYFYNFFSGPRDIAAAELVTADDADAIFRNYVNVRGEDVIDTGYELETRRNGIVTGTKNYLALVVDDRLLLVETPGLAITPRFTGALVDVPGDVQREVIAEIEDEVPDVKGMFLPMMLRDDNFRSSGYFGLAFAAALLALSAFGLITAARRAGDPASHPILRALGRFGDVRQVASDIETHLATEHPRVGDVHLTPGWLVQQKSARLDATRYDDIVWIYKQVTQHRTNGIPTGKTFVAHIYDRHGGAVSVQAKENMVNDTLSAVLQRAPWAIAGHSAEIEQAWKKNRPSLVAAVDQRRQQVLAAS